ncbi:LppP/LprE family lipoprotein [Corynebacterium sp. A21]|uniref:LppP/LprE family lipoprotein n=1 Tax=Corynebacterium sp. A21 TaxID=3457318 RepID=UPI003FCFAD94
MNSGTTEDEGSDEEGNTQCSDLSGPGAAERWAGQVPTYNDWPWDTGYAIIDGYDSCVALSWIVLPIEGGTASSPYQIMLFNQGEYLGTATSEAYGFSPDVVRLDDETIEVTGHWPREGESNAGACGTSTAQFRWDEAQGKVVMTREVPRAGE